MTTTDPVMEDRCTAWMHTLGFHRGEVRVPELLDATSEQLDLDVEIAPTAFVYDGGMFGAQLPVRQGVIIGYQSTIPVTLQLWVILHELWHLLLGHPCRPVHLTVEKVAPEFGRLPRAMIHMHFPEGSAAEYALATARTGLVDELHAAADKDFTNSRPVTLSGLSRTVYDDPNEWEAETLASISAGWVLRPNPVKHRPRNSLASILGDPG
jgi:hypothetical protein